MSTQTPNVCLLLTVLMLAQIGSMAHAQDREPALAWSADDAQHHYEGQKTTVLKSGSYAYGLAKVPHKATCASTVPCVLFIAFESPLVAVPVAKPD